MGFKKSIFENKHIDTTLNVLSKNGTLNALMRNIGLVVRNAKAIP